MVQLQAAALLMQQGLYFTAIKAVHYDFELLRATLEEMRLVVMQNMDDDNWELAAQTWWALVGGRVGGRRELAA